jgi:hypothetical protein
MKKILFACSAVVAALSVFTLGSGASAQTASIAKVKDGDKIKVAFSRYDTRGREVYVASTENMDSSVSATDKNYSWSFPAGSTSYVRDTHVAIERTAADGKKETFTDAQQLKWFPAGGDFSKLMPGEQAIRNPRCGEGTFKYTASGQAAKFKLSIAGKEQELDVQDVTLKGRWSLGSCGSGEQVMRFVYSPQLDFVVERDTKTFQSNGFLFNGNQSKVTAVN